jgi:hypothetical protein
VKKFYRQEFVNKEPGKERMFFRLSISKEETSLLDQLFLLGYGRIQPQPHRAMHGWLLQ